MECPLGKLPESKSVRRGTTLGRSRSKKSFSNRLSTIPLPIDANKNPAARNLRFRHKVPMTIAVANERLAPLPNAVTSRAASASHFGPSGVAGSSERLSIRSMLLSSSCVPSLRIVPPSRTRTQAQTALMNNLRKVAVSIGKADFFATLFTPSTVARRPSSQIIQSSQQKLASVPLGEQHALVVDHIFDTLPVTNGTRAERPEPEPWAGQNLCAQVPFLRAVKG
jgi:hypothetical protein